MDQNGEELSAEPSSMDEESEDMRNRMKEKRLLLKRQACGLAGDESQSVRRAFLRAHTFDVENNDVKCLRYLHSLGYISDRYVRRKSGTTSLGSLSALTLGPRGLSNQSNKSSEEFNDEDDLMAQDQKFAEEIYGMIRRENANINDVAVEIKSYTLAENRFHTDSVMAAIPAILDIVSRENITSANQFLKNVTEVLKTWSKLLLKFRYNEQEDVIEESIMNAIEEYVLKPKNEMFAKMFFFVLYPFVEFEVVSSESVLTWAKQREETEEEEDSCGIALLKAQGMKQWLENLEEESSEEEEGSTSEEEESDEED